MDVLWTKNTCKQLDLYCYLNPFTLRVPLESVVCYFHTFEKTLKIKQILTKYLKESCW